MVLVAVSNRVSAWLDRHTAPVQSAVYFFGSAAAAIVAAAGLLRALGLEDWTVQAPWLMALPITYLVAGRLWRGHSPERPLTWVAQAATVVILIGVLAASIEVGGIETALSPRTGERANLLYGLVFVEVAAFYALASIFGRPDFNLAFAATAACGALWELLGYFEVPPAYHTMVYAVLGVAFLAISRILGIEKVVVDRYSGSEYLGHSRQGIERLSSGQCDRLRGPAGGVPARLDAVGLSQGGILARRRAGDGHPRCHHGRRARTRRVLAAMVRHRGHRHGRRDLPHARRTHRPELVAEGGGVQCERRHPARRGQLRGPLPRDDRLRE